MARYTEALDRIRQNAREAACAYSNVNSAADATALENADAWHGVGVGGEGWAPLAAELDMPADEVRRLFAREYARAGGPCCDAEVAS